MTVDIAPTWARFNEDLIRLVDYIPDDQMNWSPRPELWNFRGILLHLADARIGWLGGTVQDGGPPERVWGRVRSKDEIKREYEITWQRVERFVNNPAQLAATYDDEGNHLVTGNWIAFHLLEHDVHHRADIFHYLALLGIATPDVGTP
jgi:uncharacterized damage-inducible protein DinB